MDLPVIDMASPGSAVACAEVFSAVAEVVDMPPLGPLPADKAGSGCGGSGGGSGDGGGGGDEGVDGGGGGGGDSGNGGSDSSTRSSDSTAGCGSNGSSASETIKAPTLVDAPLPPVGALALFRFATPTEGILMALGGVAALIHGTLAPIGIVVLGNAFNSGMATAGGDLDSDTRAELNKLAVRLVYLSAAAFVASFAQVASFTHTATAQGARIRKLYLASLLRQEMAWMDTNDPGELTARVASDVDVMVLGMGAKVAYAVQHMSTFLSGLTVSFMVGWQLALGVLATVPVLFGSAAFVARSVARSSATTQASYTAAGSVAAEAFRLFRTVAVFGREEAEAARYVAILRGAVTDAERQCHVTGMGNGLTLILTKASYAFSFWLGGRLVRSGAIDAGAVYTVFFATVTGSMGLGHALPALEAVAAARGAAPRVFAVIDRTSAMDPLDADRGQVVEKGVAGDIALEGVRFAYPRGGGAPALDGFSASVRRGQTLALVGPSGCGKTTVAQLLARLYDPQEGTVRLDGVDIREYNVPWLRAQLGFVSQMPILFSLSIADNIALGAGVVVSSNADGGRSLKPATVTHADIVAAATAAHAHQFIAALPDGYNTIMCPRGASLSGGQRQRIALARALVRRPAVLVLDEATAALDASCEQAVATALRSVARDGTTIVIIAHRLATVHDADAILVMDGGRVVEGGTHATLVSRPGGVYRRLVEAQALRAVGHSASLTVGGEDDPAVDAGPELEETNVVGAVAGSPTAKGAPAAGALDGLAAPAAGPSESGDDAVVCSSDSSAPCPSSMRIVVRAMGLHSLRRWALVVLGVAGSFLVGVTFPLLGLLVAEMVLLLGDPTGRAAVRVNTFTLYVLALGAVSCVATYAQVVSLGVAGERLTFRLRAATFRSLLRQEAAFFDDHKVGTLVSLLEKDCGLVKGLTGDVLATVFSVMGAVVVGLSVSFGFCWRSSAVVLAIFPGVALGHYLENRVLIGNNMASRAWFTRAAAVASEAVADVRTVATLGAQHHFVDAFSAELEAPVRRGRRTAVAVGAGFGFSESCLFGVSAIWVWYAARLGAASQCDFGDGMRGFMAVLFTMAMIGIAGAKAPDMAAALSAASVVFRVLDRTSAIDAANPAGASPPTVAGDVALDDVHFTYPTRPDAQVLRGLSTAMPAGGTLALVGPSGSGKSTVLALLERLYDPSHGAVTLDGTPVGDYAVSSLRSHQALVSQEPDLFSMSIRDNIAYGFPADAVVTDGQIEAAARMAAAHDFIAALPAGYATRLGDGGSGLSGGQRQRLCIARAVVRSPAVLLLDEATSALDVAAEREVQAALAAASTGRTTVVVAHRLSTVTRADCIAVVLRGAVVEAGTHATLLAAGGVYARLVEDQEVLSAEPDGGTRRA